MSKSFKVVLLGLSKNNTFKVLLKNDTIRFKVRISEKLIGEYIGKLPTLDELKAHYQLGAS